MSNLTNEQIKNILDDAHEWANHYDLDMNCYFHVDETEGNLVYLREILSLRNEVEQLKAQIEQMCIEADEGVEE